MSSNQQIFRIDKFLGLNEQDESQTELRLGEAAKMINWRITDGGNIATRPGFERVPVGSYFTQNVQEIIALWTGFIGSAQWVILACNTSDTVYPGKIYVYRVSETGEFVDTHIAASPKLDRATTKIFYYDKHVYVYYSDTTDPWVFALDENGDLKTSDNHIYEPLVITGAAPAGGGTSLEQLNALSKFFRASYSSDGTSTKYVLPTLAIGVHSVIVDNVSYDPSAKGTVNTSLGGPNEFVFNTPPGQGINNVQFRLSYDVGQYEANREAFSRLIYSEPYNGSTDSRLFFYGDGTNKAYYTGIPSEGSGLYLPAMNELDIPFTDAPITGMVRDYSKLMVFTKDGTANISYSPVTLENGDVIAGFYVGTTSKEIGNEAPNQVQVVNNYPRTLFRGDLYEWHVSSATYADERYSKRISDRIQRTLRSADLSRAVTCDDNNANTYYIFLNDEQGTVLVNHYGLDLWTMYRSHLTVNVSYAFVANGRLHFSAGRELFRISDSSAFDAPTEAGAEDVPVEAVWESGYMHFGADNLRKYSSDIWVSTRPQVSSSLTVTAATDRRSDYTEKKVVNSLLSWSELDFSNFSFISAAIPRLKRVKIKVKKFVYYKLIFRVDEPGSRATVLSVDQSVRFAGKVK